MSGAIVDPAHRGKSSASSPVASTRLLIIGLACLGLPLQALIDASPTNLATAFIACLSSILTAIYVFRRSVMSVTPISSLIVFGLSFTLLLGPLIFQTLDWRPIAFNLDAPLTAVSTAAFASLLACVTHAIYRGFPPFGLARQALSGSVNNALFVFRAPTNAQLWLMGFIGLIATWTSNTAEASGAIEFGDAGGKLLQAFTPLVLAPALIPAAPYLFRAGKPSSLNWLMLSAYFILVVILSLARNSRGGLATIIVTLILCLAISVWRGRLLINQRMVIISTLSLCAFLPLMMVLSDLSTAILVNRSARASISADALIAKTLETASDNNALQNYRARTSIIDNRYNESYIRNDFFQRLTLLKFLDLNIRHMQGITDSQRDFARQIFVKRLISQLPTPAISALGLDVDKSTLRFSGGDVYRFLAARGNMGGYVTGSALADGLAIMGLLFWPFLMGLALISFIIYDSFCRPVANLGLFVSPVILFQLDRLLMFGLNGDNLAGVIAGLIRGYPQALLIYAGVFLITSAVSGGQAPSERVETGLAANNRQRRAQ